MFLKRLQDALWIVATPERDFKISAAEFGQEVATNLVLCPTTSVALEPLGLVRGGEPPRWLLCEHRMQSWRPEKRTSIQELGGIDVWAHPHRSTRSG